MDSVWLQDLQSNLKLQASSFDCHGLTISPYHQDIISLSFRYIKVAGQVTVVSSRTRTCQFECISSTISEFCQCLKGLASDCSRVLQTDGVSLPSTLQQAHSLACIKSFRKALHTRIISSLRSPVSSPSIDVKLRSSPLADRGIVRKSNCCFSLFFCGWAWAATATTCQKQ